MHMHSTLDIHLHRSDANLRPVSIEAAASGDSHESAITMTERLTHLNILWRVKISPQGCINTSMSMQIGARAERISSGAV